MPQRNYSRASNSYRNVRKNRLLPILIIIGILAAVVLIFKFSGVGGISESTYSAQRNKTLRSEAQQAVTQVNTLSRLGATTSSGTLAKVRQYVHGIEVLNETNVNLFGEGGRLYSKAELSSIYDMIDDYETRLSSGSKVTEALTALQTAINELYTKTLSLVDAR